MSEAWRNQMMGSTNGQDVPARAAFVWEAAAQKWAAAHTRLKEATDASNRLQEERNQAQAAEQEAWDDLQESSGRVPPRAKPAPPTLDPRRY